LVAGEPDPLPDLTLALARPLAQTALQLTDRGGDEDRHPPRQLLLDGQRPLGLQFEYGYTTGRRDAVDFRAQRPVPLSGDVGDVLEEVSAVDAPDELGVVEDLFDLHAADLQVLLQLSAADPDVIGPGQGLHSLIERT